jgi:hypothetical protein
LPSPCRLTAAILPSLAKSVDFGIGAVESS